MEPEVGVCAFVGTGCGGRGAGRVLRVGKGDAEMLGAAQAGAGVCGGCGGGEEGLVETAGGEFRVAG